MKKSASFLIKEGKNLAAVMCKIQCSYVSAQRLSCFVCNILAGMQ